MNGLAYRLWKQANLISVSLTKKFPKTPEKACPELQLVKATIEMPDFLKDEYAKQITGG